MDFKVNMKTGVTFKFANGASLSLQSSEAHYCTPGYSVEAHAWGPNGERVNLFQRKDVLGWVTMGQIPALMNKVKRWKPK